MSRSMSIKEFMNTNHNHFQKEVIRQKTAKDYSILDKWLFNTIKFLVIMYSIPFILEFLKMLAQTIASTGGGMGGHL